MRSAVLLLFAAALGHAQTTATKPHKTFVTPDDYYASHPAQPGFWGGTTLDPVIAKDEGCARDLVKAIRTGGLDGRKRMVELVQFGCTDVLDGEWSVSPEREPTVLLDGVIVRKVILMRDATDIIARDLDGKAEADRADRAKNPFREGWVLDSTIVRLSKEAAQKKAQHDNDLLRQSMECYDWYTKPIPEGMDSDEREQHKEACQRAIVEAEWGKH